MNWSLTSDKLSMLEVLIEFIFRSILRLVSLILIDRAMINESTGHQADCQSYQYPNTN